MGLLDFSGPSAQHFCGILYVGDIAKFPYFCLWKPTGPSSRKISVLRRLHPVSRKFSGDWTKFEGDLRRLNPVSRITSGNWTKFEETITTLLMIVSHNLYLILHIFLLISFIICRSRGDVETSSLYLEILLQSFK